MYAKIRTLYFSPTGTTRKVVLGIAEKLAELSGTDVNLHHCDFTLPAVRKNSFSFDSEDLVVAGVPVYAGRVPNLLLKFLETLSGNGAQAVVVVLYGNRDYDDALIEFRDILASRGFRVMAAGAFIGEHSFSTTLGAGRPDARDMAVAMDFAYKIYGKAGNPGVYPLAVKGHIPYRAHYRPRGEDGNFVNILKVTPKTGSDCTDCKLCADVCPMGSIDADDVSSVRGVCIKCGACIKKCPVGARYFDDENYLWHKYELEVDFTHIRREPECFV